MFAYSPGMEKLDVPMTAWLIRNLIRLAAQLNIPAWEAARVAVRHSKDFSR